MRKAMAMILLTVVLSTACMAARADDDGGVTCMVQISSGVLYIRERPTRKSHDTGKLRAGDAVVAIGYQGGWTLVDAPVEAGTGWVKSEYLTTSTEDYGQYINSSGGMVRIRDGIGGAKIGKLKAGKQVNVTAWAVDMDGETWAFIGTGYVMAKYLSKVE